jgi:hypothetical protein
MSKTLQLYKEDFATDDAWEQVCDSLDLDHNDGNVIEVPWTSENTPIIKEFDINNQ